MTQEQLAARRRQRRVVGTYGCPRLGRVVRVRPPRGHLRDKPSPMRSWRVRCPCGEVHVRKPVWRWATEGERRAAELTLRSTDAVA